MTKTKLEPKININSLDNRTVTGHVSIIVSETITLDKITGYIVLESRGRVSARKENVLSFKISDQKKILKDELHEFPFSVEFFDNDIDSYKGKNVTFSYKCEAQVNVNEHDIGKLEKSIFSTIKSFITSNNSMTVSTYFLVEKPNAVYQIEEASLYFKLHFNLILPLLILPVIGGIALLLTPKHNWKIVIVSLALAALFIYAFFKIIENKLGRVSMKTTQEVDGFLCEIRKTRQFKLTKLKIYYNVIEKVIDNRGTSSTSYTEVLYKSPEQKLSNFKSRPQFTFNYPNKKGLQSTNYNDASILWQMNLVGYYFGLKLNYHCYFMVSRT